MRKFYLSLLAASMCVASLMAQNISPVRLRPSQLATCYSQKASMEQLNSLKHQGLTNLGKFSFAPSGKEVVATNDSVITQTPAGTLYKNAYGGGHGYMVLVGYVWGIFTDGSVMDMVDADSTFYIKNPVSMLTPNTWLKGQKLHSSNPGVEPDTVLVKFPYHFFDGVTEDGTVVKYYLQSLNQDKSLSASQEMRFTWDGDTLRKIGNEILAWTDGNGLFSGFGDDSITIFKQTDVPTSLPAGAGEPSDYSFTYKISGNDLGTAMAKGVRVGDDLYLKGLYADHDYWIKGTIKGKKVIFNKQYLGIDTKLLYHDYYAPIALDSIYDPDNDQYSFDNIHFDQPLEYDYDEDRHLLTTPKAFVINRGKLLASTINYFPCSTIALWADVPYTPPTPVVTKYQPYNYQGLYNFGIVSFNMPAISTEGVILNKDKFYYQIYLDDTPYTFTKDKYEYIDDDMTEIPYEFADYDAIFYFEPDHTIYIYDEAMGKAKKIGIQGIYKGGNTVTKGEIKWIETAGVDNITAGHDTVKSVVYTDLSGRRVSEPASGVYIKTVHYSDGIVKSTKIIR